jgi:ATP-dependent DNA helicase RecG
MMFGEMKAKGLYPPRYEVRHESAVPTVTVTLLNEQRPAVWEQVSAFLDKHGSIANRDLRKIANLDTLKATRMLRGWVEKGLLVMHGSGKKDARYGRPHADAPELFSLFDDPAAVLEDPPPAIEVEPDADKHLSNILHNSLNTLPARASSKRQQRKQK